MKITVYVSSECVECATTKHLLRELLSERNIPYEKVVVERNISEDSEARAELMMHNVLTTPAVQMGDHMIFSEDATSRQKLKAFMKTAGYEL